MKKQLSILLALLGLLPLACTLTQGAAQGNLSGDPAPAQTPLPTETLPLPATATRPPLATEMSATASPTPTPRTCTVSAWLTHGETATITNQAAGWYETPVRVSGFVGIVAEIAESENSLLVKVESAKSARRFQKPDWLNYTDALQLWKPATWQDFLEDAESEKRAALKSVEAVEQYVARIMKRREAHRGTETGKVVVSQDALAAD